MIIVRLKGGLGNQMFQYAAARHLSEKHKVPLKLDLSFFQIEPKNNQHTPRSFELDQLSITAEIATEKEIQFLRKQRWKNWFQPVWIKEKGSDSYKKIARAGKNCYLNGYWQSEKYFEDIAEIIHNEFVFKQPLSGNSLMDIQRQIENSNSISLHFRRGDYVDNPKTNKYHGLCSMDYYRSAQNRIAQNVSNPCFFVFSDDISWVKDHFSSDFPTVFIGKNDNLLHSDFRLMSLCRHNIIANSSYSWWAAWLNKNENKIVVAPKRWLANERKQRLITDRVPKQWIEI
ncbi:MAG: alpha-1,2-fucosyltransferase [Candidatus Azobacteroides sp.]|nr:alpha-1,2-fucosyltransferase [Candidatus Azobacteroides sp.]